MNHQDMLWKTRRRRAAPAPLLIRLLLVCLLGQICGAAAGCLGVRAIGFRTVAQGSITGLAPGHEEALLDLTARPGAYIVASEEQWAPLRDVLNRGAGLRLYGVPDFERYVLLAYFDGPAPSGGDRIELESIARRGRVVIVRSRLAARGATTDVGHPYHIVAVARDDLIGGGGQGEGRGEEFELGFEFRRPDGSRASAFRAAIAAPPRAATPRLLPWPEPEVLGEGLPCGWSADGRAVLWTRPDAVSSSPGQPAGPAGRWSLFAAPATGGYGELLFRPPKGVVVTAACSPDGSALAALYEADGRLRLVLLPAGGGAGSDLTPPGVALGKAFSWSPDGREIVVSARPLTPPPNRHALLAIPAAGGTARTLFAQLGEIDWPRCAPDGTIYFLRRTTQGLVLAATSLAASAPRDLLPAWRYEVSGDGAWLACVAETTPGLDTLYVVSAVEARSGLGGAVEVAHGRAGSVAWSSDGGLLAYTLGPAGGSGEAEAETDLFLAARDLGFRQRVTSGVGVSAVHFDPSGRFLAFACHAGSWQPSAPGSVLAVLKLR